MDTALLIRFGALAFAVLAITLTALQLHDRPEPVAAAPIPAIVPPADPLRAELTRCQALGEAAAGDATCLKVWADSRRRFLGQPADAGRP